MERVSRFSLLLLAAACCLARGGDAFEEMVRSTPWRSPAEALKAFSVPEGFEVQLVAAEPDIGKPISMSFDAAGRLWIAETRSYPLEMKPGTVPNDAIRILSGFGTDGKARRNVVFADGLNMPDAVAPYRDGAVVFTIPNVVHLRDTDGNGRADTTNLLFGPFGTRDAHNLANNFRRGFDGYLYGGQGVGNQSSIAGRDGATVRFSGATFRFRPDGSHFEKVGDGQANVFGLCFDPLGNLFTSDCHSMPIYQVIHGGFYPAFGKPHDGLGYAPQMLWHNHGSTAIAGLAVCDEPLWPADFRGNFLLGNVVTCRINRDRIEEHGSTRIAVEMPDFLASTDPWFRPVDVQFGPDGALYVADFYNRIIAHVEVSLAHPGRDRLSGRIWRVVRRGPDGQPRLRIRKDFDRLGLAEKVARLDDPSFAHRLAVLNALADQGGPKVVAAVRKAADRRGAGVHLRASALWILERLAALPSRDLRAAMKDPDRILRTHAVRILVERPVLRPEERLWLVAALDDADGAVQRAAADALARHPDAANIAPLLSLRHRVPTNDTHLVYQVRKALRDQLLQPAAFAALPADAMTGPDALAIADVALAVPSAASAAFLASRIQRGPVDETKLLEWVRHIARHGLPTEMDTVVRRLQSERDRSWERQVELFRAIQLGVEQRGGRATESLGSWAEALATGLLGKGEPADPARLRAGAELAATFRVGSAEPTLAAIAATPGAAPGVRAAALRALLAIRAEAHRGLAGEFLKDGNLPNDARAEVLQVLARENSPESRGLLVDVLRGASSRFGLLIATALCGSAEGAGAVLGAVADGRAPARFLAERAVKDRLLAVRPRDAELLERVAASARGDSGRLQKTLEERRDAFVKSPGNPDAGTKVFEANCVVCHSVKGHGGNIGPQLDGIGHRGLERLCEDVLNPNANVDRVFRYSVVTRANGEAFTGLFRREEGQLLVFVDATGKELPLPKAEILSRTESEASLMPDNFQESIAPDAFNDLLSFLLSQRK